MINDQCRLRNEKDNNWSTHHHLSLVNNINKNNKGGYAPFASLNSKNKYSMYIPHFYRSSLYVLTIIAIIIARTKQVNVNYSVSQ